MSDGSCSCAFRAVLATKPVTLTEFVWAYCSIVCSKDLAGPDLIKFGIESKKSCEETSTEAFIDAIDLALQDMRDVCTEGANPPHPTARL